VIFSSRAWAEKPGVACKHCAGTGWVPTVDDEFYHHRYCPKCGGRRTGPATTAADALELQELFDKLWNDYVRLDRELEEALQREIDRDWQY
jgi:hypothetical protein